MLPDNDGRLVLEVDERAGRYEGRVYLYPTQNQAYPSLVADLNLPARSGDHEFKLTFYPLTHHGIRITDPAVIAEQFPTSSLPTTIDVTGNVAATSLSFAWKGSDTVTHAIRLERGDSEKPSELPVIPVETWDAFKAYVRDLPHYRYVYRGQKKPWRLRTPFHRTGRGDLAHFFGNDIATLNRALSGSMKTVFNLNEPTHNAAFLSVVQHHGYPTPLLDWTYSPYVAAYFAFKDHLTTVPHQTDRVRIFMFDKQAWCREVQQILWIEHRWPHVSMLEPLALNNQRLIPQQALSSYATVDDIETHIMGREAERTDPQTPFLRAVDLPAREAPAVMRELTQMGITAASLFPGLDGICEEMRLRNFVFAKD